MGSRWFHLIRSPPSSSSPFSPPPSFAVCSMKKIRIFFEAKLLFCYPCSAGPFLSSGFSVSPEPHDDNLMRPPLFPQLILSSGFPTVGYPPAPTPPAETDSFLRGQTTRWVRRGPFPVAFLPYFPQGGPRGSGRRDGAHVPVVDAREKNRRSSRIQEKLANTEEAHENSRSS